MKRELKLLLTLILICMMVSACSLPFGKDDEEGSPIDGAGIEQNDNVHIIGTGVYTVGQIIGINDVIQIDPEVEDMVINKVFLATTGNVVEQLNTDAPGSYAMSIAVEFNDGSGWSGMYEYVVEDLPVRDEVKVLIDAINNGVPYKWNAGLGVDITYINNRGYNIVDVLDTTPIANREAKLLINANNNIDDYNIIVVDCTAEDYERALSEVYIQIPIDMLDLVFSYPAYEDMEIDNDIASRYIASMCGRSSQTIEYVYDLDGNSYPLVEFKFRFDFGRMDDPATSLPTERCDYYIDLGDKILAVCSGWNDKWYAERDPEFTVDINNVDSADYDISTVEGFTSFIADVFDRENTDRLIEYCFIVDYRTHVQEFIKDNLLIGKYPDGSVGSNSVNVSDSGEEMQETSGETANIKPSYQSRYPELYTWPANEVVYTRWRYVIEQGVSYVGSIILPDGTVLSVEENRNDGTSYDTSGGNGGSGGNTTTEPDTTAFQMVSLMSNYGTYYVSNKDVSGAVIDTANSTASVAQLTYMGNKYYIETARTNTISNYQASCIYSTSIMSSNDYRIEANEAGRITTEIGVITPYTIEYFDVNGDKQVKGYMSVYNLNNDYIVVYADNLDTDNSFMNEILRDMVNK